LSSDASYKLQQKLHQSDSPAEVAAWGLIFKPNPISLMTISWVGDGQEGYICTLDGQGTALGADEFDMIPEVSKERSLACEQRCDEEKMAAWGAEAFTQ